MLPKGAGKGPGDEGERKRTAKVMPPERADLILAAHVPNVELDVLIGNGLDVEPNGRDCGDILAELELVENRGFTGGIETEHKNTHLLGSEDLAHHLGKLATHCAGLVRGVQGKV